VRISDRLIFSRGKIVLYVNRIFLDIRLACDSIYMILVGNAHPTGFAIKEARIQESDTK